MKPVSKNHPLYRYFSELVRRSYVEQTASSPEQDIEDYLAHLLLDFVHTDRIFALRDKAGRRLISIADMIAEGDIRLNADSFERERQVHKHIGDFLLFWSGVYPEFLRDLKVKMGEDIIYDYRRQGMESYFVVSTFEHEPYTHEAPTFRKLSARFEECATCLRVIRDELPNNLGNA